MIRALFAAAKKIVIKIGSNTLAQADGTPDEEFLAECARACAALMRDGKQIVVVSSGAQVAGISALHCLSSPPQGAGLECYESRGVIPGDGASCKQALCAVGQAELISRWRSAFAAHQQCVGQFLCTKEDFTDSDRAAQVRYTLSFLLERRVVPILNENDALCCSDVPSVPADRRVSLSPQKRIGDNDSLSAFVALLWQADLLLLLSDIDGVYDKDPKAHTDAQHVPLVTDVSALVGKTSMGSSNVFGTGGIATKLDAARLVTRAGIPLVLANGRHPDPILSLMRGDARGTLFVPVS